MKILKVFGGFVALVVVAFVGYCIFLFSQSENEKNVSRTAAARSARWAKKDDEIFTDLENTENENNSEAKKSI